MDNVNSLSVFDDTIEQTSLFPDINKKTDVKTTKKKKRKKLNINLENALVGLHFLSMPFPLSTTKKTETEDDDSDIGTLEITWLDSDNKKHGLEILGSDKFGVINAFDRDVLIALFKLYSEQNNIIEYDYDKETYDMPIIINFSISEVLRVMGLTNGGKNTNKIKESIRRMASCTMFNKYEGGIYDPLNKKYIKSAEKSFKLLEYEMYTYNDLDENQKRINPNEIKDKTFVKIDNFFYQSMCSGYFRIINYYDYKMLKLSVSKRMYTLLESWGGKQFANHRFFYYNTLYDWIPLPKKQTIALKNRYIRDAAEELKTIGYIQDYKIEDREKGRGINFIVNYSKYDNELVESYYHDRYNTGEDIIVGLINKGVSYIDANKYICNLDKKYLGALLRLCDYKIDKNEIKETPKQFVYGGLNNVYDISFNFYNKEN